MESEYCKMEIFIPESHFAPLQDALRHAGAGRAGAYDSCLSRTDVTGYWRPLAGSRPYDGETGVLHSAPEIKVEVLCRRENVDETLRAVKAIHPYETPVIYVMPLMQTGL